MTVLILAGERDLTADVMVRLLDERDVPVVRIDMAWFPQQLIVNANLNAGRWDGTLTTPHHSVELSEIRSIWYRSPSTFQFPTGLTSARRQHAHNEAKLGVGGVLLSLPVLWINHPARHADAAYKPVQLAVAAQCGLSVSDTLITNDHDAVRRFVSDTGTTGAATKMLGASTIDEESGRRIAYTDRVHAHDLGDLAGIEITAHQFQHWIPKAYEVRLTAIGDRMFAVAIHAKSPGTYIDWRSDYTAVHWEVITPPGDIVTGVRQLLNRLGLSYGAIDFIVRPSGEWVFLEVNPGGQYGWLDALEQVHEAYGHANPITNAIADHLIQGAA